MADPIFNRDAGLESPVWDAVAVSPDNSNDLARAPTRALYIGGAGAVKVDMAGTGTAVVFSGVQAGTILPIRVDRVYVADTDATLIVALY